MTMTSFHHQFTELLKGTPMHNWLTQKPPIPSRPPRSRAATRATSTSLTTHNAKSLPASQACPPSLADVPDAQTGGSRFFFTSPLASRSSTTTTAARGAHGALADEVIAPACAPRDHAAAASFYRVVKEVVLASTLVALQETLVQRAETSQDFQNEQATAASVTTARTVLQTKLQDSTRRVMQHTVLIEEDEQRLVASLEDAIQATQTAYTTDSVAAQSGVPLRSNDVDVDAEATKALLGEAAVALIPLSHGITRPATACLSRWAGHVHFNALTVNVVVVSAADTTSGAASAKLGASRAVPLFLPSDLAEQMRVYWQLHKEAEARARLNALRNKDASAYAEHVSLLKISALLHVMEKTHDFMKRIGLNIKQRLDRASAGQPHTRVASRVSGGQPNAAGVAVLPTGEPAQPVKAVVDTSASTPASPATASTTTGLSASSEYQRFKAYVASTSDDFKLIHSVDSFVAAQPRGLQATLLPHQLDGLRFLTSLHTNHINGILADEMGVGKTIQTLAFILHLKESLMPSDGEVVNETAMTTLSDDALMHYNRTGQTVSSAGTPAFRIPPHLVLAPLSVVREWREACEQFAPLSLRVAVWGDLRDPLREAPLYDVVLLPIHAVRRLPPDALRIQFGYIVVDEAHKAVANLQTMTAQSILRLRYWRRLVLTGTPLNSDLQELWSLLHFLNPDVFHAQDSFEEVFRRPFAVYEAKDMDLTSEERGLLVLRLHQILRPFMLRRTKKDVDRSLRMTFHTMSCPITTMQSRLLSLLRNEKRTPCCATGPHDDHGGDGPDESSHTSERDSDSDTEENAKAEGVDAARDDATQSVLDDTETQKSHQYAMACVGAARAATRYRLTNSNVSESTAQALCNHALALPFLSQAMLANGLVEDMPARTIAFATLQDGGAASAANANGVESPLTLPVTATEEVSGGSADDDESPSVTQAVLTEQAHLAEDDVAETVTPTVPTQSCVLPPRHPASPVRGHGAAELALACSGKFLVLDLLLTRLALMGRKAVLFTHWLDCLDLLSDYLVGRGWGGNFEVLSGSTSEEDRKTRVHRFRTDPTCWFFLLSVKAGGCGINLQIAHIVIMLDRDYTTTNEDQALARVYRIGQRHTVRAVYMTTLDSAETRVATRAAAKNKPRQAIIEDGTYQVARDEEDADAMVRDGSEEVEDPEGAAHTTADDVKLCTSHGGSTVEKAWASQRKSEEDGDNAAEEEGLSLESDTTPAVNKLAQSLWDVLMQTACGDVCVGLPSPLAIQQSSHQREQQQEQQNGSNDQEGAVCAMASTDDTAERQQRILTEGFARLENGFSESDSVAAALPAVAGVDAAAEAHVLSRLNRRMTDKAWHTLRALISELDALVCTEEDLLADLATQKLDPYLPPVSQSQFTDRWHRETADTIAAATAFSAPSFTPCQRSSGGPPWQNAHEWARVVLTWLDATDGPWLLQHALHSAVTNDITRQDPAYTSWCKQQRNRRRDAKLALLYSVHPPEAFKLACWEQGVEDDAKICRLFVRHQEAQQARKVAAEQARRARQQEKEDKAAARAAAVAARAQQAEERKRAKEKAQSAAATSRAVKRPRARPPSARAQMTKRAKLEAVASTPVLDGAMTPPKKTLPLEHNGMCTMVVGEESPAAGQPSACNSPAAVAHQ